MRDDDAVAELYDDVPPAPQLDSKDGVALMRRLLFEDEDTVFDIDRVFGLISGFVSQMSDQPVEDRTPLAECGLRDPEQWRLLLLRRAELDGAAGDELLAGYESTDGERRRAYDVIRWR